MAVLKREDQEMSLKNIVSEATVESIRDWIIEDLIRSTKDHEPREPVVYLYPQQIEVLEAMGEIVNNGDGTWSTKKEVRE